jgi:hypothetical protein
VDGEAVPDLSPEFVSEQVGERLLAVDVEVIDKRRKIEYRRSLEREFGLADIWRSDSVAAVLRRWKPNTSTLDTGTNCQNNYLIAVIRDIQYFSDGATVF